MNRTCQGDVFARWGETWARCFLDSALFQITDPIETCPNCGRPWEGREIQRDGRQLLWDPDKDPRVMVADRDRRTAALESELAAERARADAALSTAAREWQSGYDGEPTPPGEPNEWRARGGMLRQCEAFVEQAESRADAEAANGAMLREAVRRYRACIGALTGPVRGMALLEGAKAAAAAAQALDDLLAAAPSTGLARVQGLVDCMRDVRDELKYRRGSNEFVIMHNVGDEMIAGIGAALDAFTGTNTGDGK